MHTNGSGMVNPEFWKGIFLLVALFFMGTTFIKAQSYDITISVTPDCWGYETSWTLEDSGGTIISSIAEDYYDYSNPNGPGTYDHVVSVSAGECYTFTIMDEYGDGMYGSQWGSCNVDGDFEITYGGTTIVSLDDPDFGYDDEYDFCMTAGCTDSEANNYDSSAMVDDGSCSCDPPTAGFTYSVADSGCGEATVTFTNTSTNASSYAWTFAHGTPSNSTDASPTVVFPTGGDWAVTLTATAGAESASASQDITTPLDEEGTKITFVLSPDCWGSEIAWEMKDSGDNVLYSADYGDYPDEFPLYTTEERTEMCLTDDCYTFSIYDSSWDGLAGDSYWICDEDGTYWFEDETGNIILEFDDDPDYGYQNDETPCINYLFVWHGALDDDWQNAGNWEGNLVPSSEHNVKISTTGSDPNMDETVTVEKLIIDENSAIDFENGSGKIKLEGDLIIEGTLNVYDGMILMQGDEHQYIKGDAIPTFYQLKINSTDTVTILNDANFRGPLIPTQGVFDFNGNHVTLISEEDYTGSIGEITNNADILGDTITIERYFPAGPASWRMLSTPITDATFEQWNDDIPTTGFTGADYPNYPSVSNPWSNIRTYDETVDPGGDKNDGFVSIDNITDTIGTQEGYFVYMVPAPTTIDVTGAFKRDTQSITLEHSGEDPAVSGDPQPEPDGWNLIANPYPSAIDWDASSGWTKNLVNDAIYAYDPVSGQYSSYVNGISVGDLEGAVASSQAFWVKTTYGAPTVEMDEAVKVNTTGVHMKSQDMATLTTIRIKLQGEGVWDETVIGFHEGATEAFDGALDAYKFYAGNASLPNLATKADSTLYEDDDEFSINMWPVPVEELPLDLIVRKGDFEEFMLINEMVDSFDDNICLVLEDHELEVTVPFNQGDYYFFTMSDESAETRFSLRISAPLEHTQTAESCPDMDDGTALAEGFGPAPWDFIWKNASGDVIKETLDSDEPDMIENLAPGFYEVIVQNDSESCPSASKVIMIEAATNTWGAAEALTLTCENEETATLAIETEPMYTWTAELKNGEGEVVATIENLSGDSTLTNLPADEYTMTLMSSCGTEVVVDEIDTRSPQSVEAEFFTEEVAVVLQDGGVGTFLNNSSNALNFVWDYGNGVIDSTNIDGYCTYTEIGLYQVSLTAYNDYCSDTYSGVVAVVYGEDDVTIDIEEISMLNPDKFENNQSDKEDDKMDITYGPNNIVVRSDIEIADEVIFQIFNGAGQLVHEEVKDRMDLAPIELNIQHLSQGVFYINIVSNDTLLKTDKFLKN